MGSHPQRDQVRETQLDLESRLISGRAYLEQALEAGHCQDFWKTSHGVPPIRHSNNVFLSYFLARALHVTGGISEPSEQVLRQYLAFARQGDSYGYASGAPMDADDTAFSLRTRLLLGDRLEAREIQRALAPFASEGNWLTFVGPKPASMEWVMAYENESSVLGPHLEVNLNVASLIREAGLPDIPICWPVGGLPANYHYPSKLYAAFLISEGECAAGQQDPFDSQIFALQSPNGGWPKTDHGFSAAQETALALLTLSDEAFESDRAGAGLNFLVSCQGEDGRWEGGVLWTFRVPGTGGTIEWWAEDSMSILATSLALIALQRCTQ